MPGIKHMHDAIVRLDELSRTMTSCGGVTVSLSGGCFGGARTGAMRCVMVFLVSLETVKDTQNVIIIIYL